MKRLILACVDDDDAFAEGENALQRMQTLIMHLVKLFCATGALMSIQKTKHFLWQWTIENGKFVIRN